MNLWMVRNTGHDIEAGCSSKPEEHRGEDESGTTEAKD
jgi:hypothetical protein